MADNVERLPKTNIQNAPQFFKVPANVFAAMRQVIGQLPHDQVGNLCKALDEQCSQIKEESD